MNGYKEVNISVLLEEIGEELTKAILADYSCPLNEDIEDFIHNKAILFSKQGFARTHLVFAGYKGEAVLVGFYALACRQGRKVGTLVSEHIRKTTYDDLNDILSISFSNDRGMSYSDGGPIGIEIMKDMETNQLTGLIIYYPVKKQRERQQRLKEMGFSFKLSDFLK